MLALILLSLTLTGCFGGKDFSGEYISLDINQKIISLTKTDNKDEYLLKTERESILVKIINDKDIVETGFNTSIGTVLGEGEISMKNIAFGTTTTYLEKKQYDEYAKEK